MKQQTSFADLKYSARRKSTRKEKFLTAPDCLVSWSELTAPHCHHGEHNRPPVGLELMRRMCLCQSCLDLSDGGIKDTIVDSIAVREFVGVNLLELSWPVCRARFYRAAGLPGQLFYRES